MSAISQGRAAGAGRGATIVAAACSAALHGALAAGVFLWPAGPVPYSAGNPIIVELIATAREKNVGTAAATAGAVSSDDDPSDAEVALSVQSGPSDTEPTEGAAVAPAPSPPRPEPVAATPVVPPRPARRPTAPPLEHMEHTDSARGGLETPAASDTTTDGPVVALPGGESASSETNAGSDAPSGGEVAAAPQVGPRFAIGSAGNPLPRYPTAARRRGLEGRVVLRVFVAADGRARSVSVRAGSPHPILDEAAVETLRRWRFEPARQAGVPVAAWIDVPITFRLSD